MHPAQHTTPAPMNEWHQLFQANHTQGRAFINEANDFEKKNKPDRLPSSPRRRPAWHMSWQGNPAVNICGFSRNPCRVAAEMSTTSSIILPRGKLPSAALACKTCLAPSSLSRYSTGVAQGSNAKSRAPHPLKMLIDVHRRDRC